MDRCSVTKLIRRLSFHVLMLAARIENHLQVLTEDRDEDGPAQVYKEGFVFHQYSKFIHLDQHD